MSSKCVSSQQLLEVLNDALRQLPEKQRSTLWLHYFHGCSLDEIAKITSVKRETTFTRHNGGER